MKMNRVILLVFVTVFCGFQGMSQVISGFKGRRTVIGANVIGNPSPTGVYKGFGLDIERVKQNYVSLNYSFKYFTNNMDVLKGAEQHYYYDEEFDLFVSFSSGGSVKINRQEHKITYKFYSKKRGSLAPTGAYWNMGLSFDVNQVYGENHVVTEAGTPRKGTFDKYQFFDVVPHISRGYKFILADNVFIDLEFLFRVSLIEYNAIGDSSLELREIGFKQAVLRDIKYTNLINSMFGINLGLKYAL